MRVKFTKKQPLKKIQPKQKPKLFQC